MQPSSNLAASQALMEFDVNNLRIASPCPKSWNEMTGDDRTRHCDLCELSVHNVEGMTRDEVARLIGKGGGRLCMRLVRRADGTVMTKDCPVGLGAYRKRVTAVASAALAAVLGLFSVSYGQKDETSKKVDGQTVRVARSDDKTGMASLSGTLVDPNGALVPGVAIFLNNKQQERLLTIFSDADGRFSFSSLEPGTYDIEVSGAMGFRRLIINGLELQSGKAHGVTLELDVDPTAEVVGELIFEPNGEPEISQNDVDFSLLKITPRPVKKP